MSTLSEPFDEDAPLTKKDIDNILSIYLLMLVMFPDEFC